MHWNHSFQYWWLIPVLLIFLCFAMCCVMRRRETPGCCMGGRSWRGGWRDRPTGVEKKGHLANKAPTSMEEKTQTESLKTAVQGLDQRLRNLEERLRAKEIVQNPPSKPA